MKFIDLVKTRKSVRKYTDRPVSRENIDICLDAARLAPSACNSQPWSFVVVDDKDTKDKLAEAASSGIYRMNTFIKTAPVIIVVITEKSKYVARLGGTIRNVKYNLIDVGIACDHLTLQAAELGLGTCYLGWFHEKSVKKILGIPNSKKLDLIISLGYPENPELKTKLREPLDNLRRYFIPGL
ncbi:MAG: nitroreductase family protein [Fibrobacteria bacterium]|nr:nitroreductase family protein [Fibrobacteria bacterium]